MADQVQYVLDRMAPVMVELQRLGLFDMQETKQIIKFRRDHEYILKRRQLTVQDFLQYLEYEINLETLRRARMKRMNITNAGKAEGHGIRHVSYIFERGVRRFPNDLKLWEAYLNFLQNHNSKAIFSSVLIRAIHLHPREEQLWIKAATMETVNKSNSHAARVLMQRAIRINPHSKVLWLFYFKQEVFEVLRVRKRRQVLGLSVDASSALGEEGEDTAGLRGLLRGDIPSVVFKHAVEAVPNDLEFVLQFYSQSYDAREELPVLVQTIEERIKSEFVESPETYLRIASLKLQGSSAGDTAATAATAQRKRRRAEDTSSFCLNTERESAIELLSEGLRVVNTLEYRANAAEVVLEYLKDDATLDDTSHSHLSDLLVELFAAFDSGRRALAVDNSASMIRLAGLYYEYMLLVGDTSSIDVASIPTEDTDVLGAVVPLLWLVQWTESAFQWFTSPRSVVSTEERESARALTALAHTALVSQENLSVYLALHDDSLHEVGARLDEMKRSTAQVILGLWKHTCTNMATAEQLVHALDYLPCNADVLEACSQIATHISITIVDSSLVCFWCAEYIRRALQLGGVAAMLEAHGSLMKNTFAGAAADGSDSGFLDYFLLIIDTIIAQTVEATPTARQQVYDSARKVYEQALRVMQGGERKEVYDRYAKLEIAAGHPERANNIRWRAQRDRV